MSFNQLPTAAKYTIIFGIILFVTISLLVGRYIYVRRKEQEAWKRLHRDVEAKFETQFENQGYAAPSQRVPTTGSPPLHHVKPYTGSAAPGYADYSQAYPHQYSQDYYQSHQYAQPNPQTYSQHQPQPFSQPFSDPHNTQSYITPHTEVSIQTYPAPYVTRSYAQATAQVTSTLSTPLLTYNIEPYTESTIMNNSRNSTSEFNSQPSHVASPPLTDPFLSQAEREAAAAGPPLTLPARPGHERNNSGFSHVASIFNIKSPEPPRLAARQSRARSNLYNEVYQNPSSSLTKSSSCLPVSPFAFSPAASGMTAKSDLGITSPQEDEVYIRAPRLYDPPIMAYGIAELPLLSGAGPIRRIPSNRSTRSRRSIVRRGSKVHSMTNLPKLMRMPTNASVASSFFGGARRGHERASSYDEWVDTLTAIDDSAEVQYIQGSPDSAKPLPLFAGRSRSSIGGRPRRIPSNGSTRRQPYHTKKPSVLENVPLQELIDEEAESALLSRGSHRGTATSMGTSSTAQTPFFHGGLEMPSLGYESRRPSPEPRGRPSFS